MATLPLVLPMGWKNSPPVFSAVTNTIANLANQRIQSSVEPPGHHLDEAAEVINASNPLTTSLSGTVAGSPGDTAVESVVGSPGDTATDCSGEVKTSREATPTPAKPPPNKVHLTMALHCPVACEGVQKGGRLLGTSLRGFLETPQGGREGRRLLGTPLRGQLKTPRRG